MDKAIFRLKQELHNRGETIVQLRAELANVLSAKDTFESSAHAEIKRLKASINEMVTSSAELQDRAGKAVAEATAQNAAIVERVDAESREQTETVTRMKNIIAHMQAEHKILKNDLRRELIAKDDLKRVRPGCCACMGC